MVNIKKIKVYTNLFSDKAFLLHSWRVLVGNNKVTSYPHEYVWDGYYNIEDYEL